jgi:hypothetical protein
LLSFPPVGRFMIFLRLWCLSAKMGIKVIDWACRISCSGSNMAECKMWTSLTEQHTNSQRNLFSNDRFNRMWDLRCCTCRELLGTTHSQATDPFE